MQGTLTRYGAPLPSLETLLGTLQFVPDVGRWRDELARSPDPYARACLDRYLLIQQSLVDQRLWGASILDLGCGSGFFSFCLGVSIASEVTAVDDGRAVPFYGESASVAPLKTACAAYGLGHVNVAERAIESLLAECAGRRQWDAVLLLDVLHHMYTGYGDDPSVGKLTEPEIEGLVRRLGLVTGRALYFSIDAGRADPEKTLGLLQSQGGFGLPKPLGMTAAAAGPARTLWELRKP
jgi:SAM-dependent methyltransferase